MEKLKSTDVEQWKSECSAFEDWFKALGGNIGNNEQMSEAFRRIEAKNVSDNRLYELLETPLDIIPDYSNSNWKEDLRSL